MLVRLARFCFRRRRTVVAAWILAVFVLSAVGWGAIGPDFHTDFKLPDSETKQVFDFLKARSPKEAGFDAQIVFTSRNGADDPAVKGAMTKLFDDVAKLPRIKVTSPYSPFGAFQISKDRTIAFASLNLQDATLKKLQDSADAIRALGSKVHVPGLKLDYGGQVFYKFALPASEALGIFAAVIILLIAFGSVLAMGLPVGTALAGLFSGLALVAMVSNIASMPDFVPAMAAMIGLGVGIDYALFIVTRHREGLHAGLDAETAVVRSLDSAGRAVMFAGGTVIISLMGLFVTGLAFVNGIAIASICAVVAMMLASMTLLPALLGFAGDHLEVVTYRGALALIVPVLFLIPAVIAKVNALAVIGFAFALIVLIASRFVPALRRPVPIKRHDKLEETFWWRWSRTIQHRPWPALVIGAVVLIGLSIPLFSIRLGFGDTGNLPAKETARRAYDELAKGFGPGFNGQLLVLVTAPGGQALAPASVASFGAELAKDPGVAFVSPGRPLGPDASVLILLPRYSPQDEATTELVHRLRDTLIPASKMDAKVGGAPAANVDFADFLGRRLPVIVGMVLVLSFLLLMVVFRSLLVPLKAVIMNLLSIGAAYGVVVAIFQWGWLKTVIGIDKPGPVEAWVPMMLFAIVFGLSMDYEVFLLSRMKEQFDRTGDNATAVADGLAVTARVITAAALIMVCVFSSFVLGEDRQLKLFGLGLAVAVLFDATVVRMVLVPATMELLGDRNWWFPKRLDRILPHVHIEGHPDDFIAPAPPPPEPEPDPDREPAPVP